MPAGSTCRFAGLRLPLQLIGVAVVFTLALPLTRVDAAMFDFEVLGAVAESEAQDTVWANGRLLNTTLNRLAPGDVFVVPNKTFNVMGGILVLNRWHITFRIDGTLKFAFSNSAADNKAYLEQWPTNPVDKDHGKPKVLHCLHFVNSTNLTVTSSGMGTLDGAGDKWWGIPGIGYLVRGENRPRVFQADGRAADDGAHCYQQVGGRRIYGPWCPRDILFENILMVQPPYWTFYVDAVDGMEVRNSHIDVRRDKDAGHSIVDQTAFNTDGFDVTGNNVWIHDVSVWNDDDCICAKDWSTNMLFERIEASGEGLTIGSIGGGSFNDNITFRDIHMQNTDKGIYMKFRGGGTVSNVLYENIVIDHSADFPIWIGPAQQSDSDELCAAHPCSLCWPEVPGSQCFGINGSSYTNITLRNVTANSPAKAAGVLLATSSWPMRNVLFDGVRVVDPAHGLFPWQKGGYYKCEGVESGVATGGTSPVPACFKSQ